MFKDFLFYFEMEDIFGKDYVVFLKSFLLSYLSVFILIGKFEEILFFFLGNIKRMYEFDFRGRE